LRSQKTQNKTRIESQEPAHGVRYAAARLAQPEEFRNRVEKLSLRDEPLGD
jgi:hypothetical protein